MHEMTIKARRTLVEGYDTSPQLLEYKLFQIFTNLTSQEQVAVFNDIMDDIQIMVGESKTILVEKIARAIINTGMAEMMKEKK